MLDLDLNGIQAASLDVDFFYHHVSGDDATIAIWNGTFWEIIWIDPDTDVDDHITLDLTSFTGNTDFQVQFDYQNASNSGWFSVDNVFVEAVLGTSCQTGAAPPPVPDGRLATTPLAAARLDPQAGTIAVTWDATSCPAASYNLLYGSLAAVSSYVLDGAACDIGTGTFQWSSVPAADLFFLVVGFDGTATESSWGAGTLGERNGLTPSGQCSASLKNIASTCP